MATWNLGSVGVQIHATVENIPSNMSGTVLLNIIDQQRVFAEQYTGFSIGSVAIDEKYQSALIDLSVAELLHYMQIIGVDASHLSIGDFQIRKGQGSNLSDAANLFRERGLDKLHNVGWRFATYQSL